MKHLTISTLGLGLITVLLNMYARTPATPKFPELEHEIARLESQFSGKTITKGIVHTQLPLADAKRIGQMIDSDETLARLLDSKLPAPVKGLLLTYADYCTEQKKCTLRSITDLLKASFGYEYKEV